MWTDGDVYGHPETSTKHSNPNAKITPTTTLSTMQILTQGKSVEITVISINFVNL